MNLARIKRRVKVPYTTEWKPTKAENSKFKCRKCGSDDIEYRMWDSSDEAHTDVEYKCNGCGRGWWVEGPDY